MPPHPSAPLLAWGTHLHALLAGRTRVVVAVSGGPDSQALLDCVGLWQAELQLTVWAVGIDHGLRPAARAELVHAEKLAQSHAIPFLCKQVVVDRTGNSLAAARQARYRALRATVKNLGAQAILVAHHANDQVETVLFHLARGTGLRGAAGIAPCRGLVVRPFLHATRSDIMQHITERHIPFAQDPSNTQRMRGSMRQHVAQALTAINSRYAQHIAAFAQVARQEDQLLQRWAARVLARSIDGNNRLDGTLVAQAPRALWPRILAAWLKPLKVRPNSTALGRLCRALAEPHTPLAQGALGRAVVRRQGKWLVACPTHLLPARRAGT